MAITKDPNKDYFEAYKFLLEDTCDTEQRIEDCARMVLNDNWVNGDSYGVPGSSSLVNFLVAYIHVLRGLDAPVGEDDMQWAIDRIKQHPELTIKHLPLQT